MQVKLVAFSGRRTPIWSVTEEEVKEFKARFEAIGKNVKEQPLKEGFGYHCFEVIGFKAYDKPRIWNGLVDSTHDDKTYQWHDEGKSLEKYLLKTLKSHLNEMNYKMAASQVEKN